MTLATILAVGLGHTLSAAADTIPASLSDSDLQVETVLSSGLSQPLGMVSLSATDFLVLETANGQVKRALIGVLQATPVLDLGVDSNSKRGLLGMALDPKLATNHAAYSCWKERSSGTDSTVGKR